MGNFLTLSAFPIGKISCLGPGRNGWIVGILSSHWDPSSRLVAGLNWPNHGVFLQYGRNFQDAERYAGAYLLTVSTCSIGNWFGW